MKNFIEKKDAIIAYKAFNTDLTCRDFQYEIGKEYSFRRKIAICKRGFHACFNPFDILIYYFMLKARFARVKMWGNIEISPCDGKICASNIYIEEEISLNKMIDEYKIYINSISEKIILNSDYEDLIITANCLVVSNSCYSNIINPIHRSRIFNLGKYSNILSNEIDAQIVSDGNNCNINTNGYGPFVVSNGLNSNICTHSSHATIVSTGPSTNINSFGFYTNIYSSGANARIISVGSTTNIESVGENAIITCYNQDALVKAVKGNKITFNDYGKKVTKIVDGINIRENTWYRVQDGRFCETIL